MAAIAASIRAWPSKMKTSIQQLGQDYKRVAFDLAGFAKEKPLRYIREFLALLLWIIISLYPIFFITLTH